VGYLYLVIAIVAEVAGTSALKASEGFSRPIPSLVVVVGFATAFFFLSLTLRTMPLGIAYAIWAGAGTALIVLMGAIAFRQVPDLGAIVGIGLIIAGVAVINLTSRMGAH
jgi:small multidrug resistance pump